MTTPTILLHRVAEILSDESRLHRGDGFACDAQGRKVDPDSPLAVRWCVLGALMLAVAELQPSRDAGTAAHRALYDALPTSMRQRSLVVFTSRRSTTFADVRALLERALRVVGKVAA